MAINHKYGQSVQESQAAVSRVFNDIARVFDTVCHWISPWAAPPPDFQFPADF